MLIAGGVAIGIDVGTSGVRAALVDAAREPVAWGEAALDPRTLRQPGAWWQATTQALAALAAKAEFGAVRALAIDGTSGTIVAVDEAGAPLGAASLYNDAAEPAWVQAVAGAAPADSAARGGTSPLARLLALRDTTGIARVLHQADWVAGCLSGRLDVTDANNALKTGYDPRLGAWPEWLGRLGRIAPLLPDVVAPATPIGPILPAVARRLGLPPATMVVAGTTDGCAAFLATGATEIGEAVTSLGSTLVLKVLCETPVMAPAFGIYSHLMLGRWLAGGASNSGGAALLRHFTAADLARLSARIDPAADSGLDYYPLPARGERFPVNDAGFPSRETPRPPDDAAFLHGLLEGIGRIEALGYRRLAEFGAPAPVSVRSVGGGARNRAWTALRERLLQVPMVAARSEEAAVGTAGLALHGVGAV